LCDKIAGRATVETYILVQQVVSRKGKFYIVLLKKGPAYGRVNQCTVKIGVKSLGFPPEFIIVVRTYLKLSGQVNSKAGIGVKALAIVVDGGLQ
jgi:hypothetical protein